MGSRVGANSAMAVLLAWAVLPMAGWAQSWVNSPASRVQAGEAANAGSGTPRISPDGRYIAFNSGADNLVLGQIDPSETDVFLFDRQTDTMTLVSHAAGNPLLSSSPGFSQTKAIASGGVVLFDSTAPHLIAGETAGYVANSYLHFPVDGSNRLISHAVGDNARSNGECRGRAIDQSAQFAVIACTSTNLQSGITDNNGQHDLYLYRVGWNDNTLITHAGNSLTTATDIGVDAFSGQVMVTDFGQYVAFTSRATNLVAGQSDSNNAEDVFLYETQTGIIRLVSHIGGNNAASGAAGATLVAVDAGHVIFNSNNANHVSGGTDSNGASDVFSYEIATATISLVSHAGGAPLTAANGSSVAAPGRRTDRVLFDTTASNISAAFTGALTRDVLLWYRDSGLYELVSHAPGAPLARANAAARAVATNISGSRAVFETTANNIVAGHFPALTNNRNLYVFDANSSSNQLITHRHAQPAIGSARAADLGSVQVDWSGDHIVLATPAGDLAASSDGNALPDIYVHNQPGNTAGLVSRAAFARAASADRASTPVGLSADGRYVLQRSLAANLGVDQIESDVDNDADVFVFDADTGSQTLVSYAIEGFDVLTNVPANAASQPKAISRDGRWVLFSSTATNLLAFQNDSNGAGDVFLRDHIGSGISLVSHASNGTNIAANAEATPIAVSGDGRWVLYESRASNVVAGIADGNGSSDVFLFDRDNNLSSLVSKANGAANTGNDASRAVALSPDGRYVLYHSYATNLIAGFVNLNGNGDDVYLYDRASATSRLVSRESGSAVRGANAGATAVALSDSGDRIVFYSAAGNLLGTGTSNGQSQVFMHQVSTASTRLVSHSFGSETDLPNGSALPLAISGDGSAVLFSATGSTLVNGFVDGNGAAADIYWYDAATRVNTLFSRSHAAATQGSNREWQGVRVNADASRVVFSTMASDVINGVNPGSFFAQVFQYERSGGVMRLVSHRANGTLEAGNNSSGPLLSDDGNRIAFASQATNLADWNDNNGAADTFLSQRVGGYVVTPVVSGNGSVDPSGPQAVAAGATVAFTLTPGIGQRIASASGCGGTLVGDRFTTAPATADCAVSIVFAPLQFALQYLAGAHGAIGGDALQTVDYGGSGTEVQAIADVGYQFDRWSDDYPDASRTDANVTANLSVTALFTIRRFNLLYSAGPGGTIDGQPSRLFTVDYGADGPTVNAVPDAGRMFVSWSDGVATAVRSDLDVTGHVTVQAQFAEIALLTVTPIVGPNGSANPDTPQMVAPGATAFFDLAPNPGYRIGTVSGCDGMLVGHRYTTGAVHQNCSVNIAFNRTPTAQNGSLAVVEDGGAYGGQLGATDDDSLAYVVVTPPAKGNLIVQAGGQYFYAPNADANGSDSFTFKVNDGVQDSNNATVSIDIAAVNDQPSFALDPAILPEHAAGTSGAQTRNGILTALDFGPPDEDASQSTASVSAIEIFDPANILSGVSVSNAGVLNYTLSGGAGLARVMVVVTDSGGTANGGVAASEPRQLTISVRNASDLQITDSNGANSLAPGQAVVYEVLVANAGPYAATDAILDVPVPAGLSDVLWSCNPIQFASCPQAQGAGAITALPLDLPNAGVLRFLVSGNVSAAIGATVQHTASITVADPMQDIDAGNDIATDADPVAAPGIHIFASGFETQAHLAVPIPADSILYP